MIPVRYRSVCMINNESASDSESIEPVNLTAAIDDDIVVDTCWLSTRVRKDLSR